MKLLKRLVAALVVLGAFGFSDASSADVEDFSFSSFEVSYALYLNAEKENRPEMLVTETLVAKFPEIDQNHGIRRSIPDSSYGKYPALLDDIEVLDEFGQTREFEISSENGFIDLAIKPEDGSFVHGKQIYVIKYRQAWVINNYQSTSGFDEFYWDVNGTGWQQTFDQVKATVTLDESLREILVSDKIFCYQGPQGSTEKCSSMSEAESSLTFTSGRLGAFENLTIAIPFEPNVANTTGPIVEGTFSWYGYWLCVGALALVMLWALYFRIFRIRNQGKELFIVPQYKPSPEPGLFVSAFVLRKTARLFQASVVELAVKKLIEIESVEGSKNKDFILRRTSLEVANPNQGALLSRLGLTESGSELLLSNKMPENQSTQLSKSLIQLKTTTAKEATKQGYFQKRALGIPAAGLATALVLFIALTYFAAVMDTEAEAGFIALPVLLFMPYVAVYVLLMSKRTLTLKGSELVAHVKGLEMYIELAEKDRLEYLQSPTGASLKPSEVKSKQVLKLYEELLPWAILLGLQKEWAKVLNDLYGTEGSPVWIIGASNFGDSFSNLDESLTASLGSSSSGGSSGGGSSGGGGGGGGGGGI
ncbi:MAG: hypothetical protein RJA78_282 [Actinomycetota bacterium]